MSFDDLPSYTTEGGVEVSVQVTSVEPLEAIEDLVCLLYTSDAADE